jgi:hypothetical protein
VWALPEATGARARHQTARCRDPYLSWPRTHRAVDHAAYNVASMRVIGTNGGGRDRLQMFA